MLTAERAGLPARTSTICSAMSMATLTWASSVDAPRCGVWSTFGKPISGLSAGTGLGGVDVDGGSGDLAGF